jgi:Domain of unknown function (DUF6249)
MDPKTLGLMIPILGIVMGVGLWIAVVWIIVAYRAKRDRLIYETAVQLADKGVVVPKELFANINSPASDLRRGVVLLALGAGLSIALWEVGAPWTFGLIPAFVGIGYLIVWQAEKRSRHSENNDRSAS